MLTINNKIGFMNFRSYSQDHRPSDHGKSLLYPSPCVRALGQDFDVNNIVVASVGSSRQFFLLLWSDPLGFSTATQCELPLFDDQPRERVVAGYPRSQRMKRWNLNCLVILHSDSSTHFSVGKCDTKGVEPNNPLYLRLIHSVGS